MQVVTNNLDELVASIFGVDDDAAGYIEILASIYRSTHHIPE
jgi:hypothetical protein